MNMHVPALQRSLPDLVDEYDAKKSGMLDAVASFKQAGNDLKMACTIGGTWGKVTIDTGDRLYESSLFECLLKSAWYHVHQGLNIDRLASPNDKKLFEQAMAKPPPFTLDNIRATFGKYLLDPRGNILRGLAEVFCGLDPSYKSHDKVKIGVEGLPKRIIVESVGGYGSYGRDKLISVVNALATYQGKPLFQHQEFDNLDALNRYSSEHIAGVVEIEQIIPSGDPEGKPTRRPRGITVKKYKNGNAHVIFDKDTLRDINMALAEFYGDVVCDTTDEKPTQRKQSTAVSKDLQYYPTPVKVVKNIIDEIAHTLEGQYVLEPNCGCGRFMDALRAKGAKVFGIEVDLGRVMETRAKGHVVYHGNFLDYIGHPEGLFDRVVMNPPFYGQHYAKHVIHAMKFLKPGGTLTAILPVTAKEHGLLDHLIPKSRHFCDGPWSDLPVGSFSESGTNINTTVLRLHKPE